MCVSVVVAIPAQTGTHFVFIYTHGQNKYHFNGIKIACGEWKQKTAEEMINISWS